MNWLAHFALSPLDDRVLMGNWLADLFGRSRLEMIRDPKLKQGLSLHALIDAATDRHPRMLAVRADMPAELRRTGGIVLDVVWDHFLSIEFQERTGRPLAPFVAGVLSGLERALPVAPDRTEAILIRMRDENWLGSYSTIEGVELTLTRIGRRLSPQARAKLSPQLASAYLQAKSPRLREDFDAIWRDVSATVTRSGLGAVQAGQPRLCESSFHGPTSDDDRKCIEH